ncbi:MAG: hypothetical protein V5783_01855 [Pontiella sp.]
MLEIEGFVGLYGRDHANEEGSFDGMFQMDNLSDLGQEAGAPLIKWAPEENGTSLRASSAQKSQ